MWYTGLVILDGLLFWGAARAVQWLAFALCGVDEMAWHDMAHAWGLRIGVAHELVDLLVHGAPVAALMVLYYLLPPPGRADWFRHARVWHWMRTSHNPITWKDARGEKLEAFPHSDQTVLYAVAPHSMYAEHVTLGMALNPAFEEVRVVCTSLLWRIPIARECASLAGCVPANMVDIMRELDVGHSVVLVPEGMRGALHRGRSLEVLRGIEGECGPRHGFIRAALTAAKPCVIVPVYVHGTEELYVGFNPWPWLQRVMLARFMYPWPMVHWGWWGSFLPRAAPLEFRVGDPIKPEGSVEALHESFCTAMEKLAA